MPQSTKTFTTTDGLVIDLATADDLWLSFFEPEAVGGDGSIYVSDGSVVFPDGRFGDE